MLVVWEPTPAVPLRELPKDGRGYRVPAEAPWTDDGPQLSKVEPLLRIVLTAYRACAVCGYAMRQDELVWRIHDEYSRKVTFADMRDGAGSHQDVPGHLLCMLYSALVCPFWRTPVSRYGKDTTTTTPGSSRGEQATILGYGDYALVLDLERPYGGPSGKQGTLLYKDYREEILFRDPLVDLADRYEQERVRVGGRYVKGKRRHYAPIFGGTKRLKKEGEKARDALDGRGPDRVIEYDGGLAWLCVSGWMRDD